MRRVLELLREMRADVRTRQIPVIMISGVTEEEPRIRALEAGANDFLVKPFSERELIVKMKAQLESAALRAAEDEAEERPLITELKQAGRRAALLAEAGRILASTLDYEYTLASVAQLAVPSMADWCAVDVRAEDGRIHRLAVAGADPSPAESGRDGEPSGIARTIQTGRAELFAEGPERWAMAAPLVARGRILGALSFGTGESRREYSREDLAFCPEPRRPRRARHRQREAPPRSPGRQSHQGRLPGHPFPRAADATQRHRGLGPPAEDGHARRRGRAARRGDDRPQRPHPVTARGGRAGRLAHRRGEAALEFRPVELGAVLEAALDTVRASARAKGIGITANMDPAAGPVSGDVDRLQQVFWNLLSNAVKFTPEAGEIRIRLARVGTRVEAVVEDTGIGLSVEFLPHVFERFRQADGSSTRRHGGLGLGLSIARHLVELHGGTLTAASPGPGRGAAFTVALPLTIGFEPAPNPPRAERDLSPPSIEGVRVLIVDDDADTRELLSTILVRGGARVAAVPSAADALAAIERERPDVLLSDIEMPGQNGYDLIRRVREPAERGGRIAAAALTAYARPEDRLEALRAGFQFHMAKPVDPRELVTVVASLADRLES